MTDPPFLLLVALVVSLVGLSASSSPLSRNLGFRFLLGLKPRAEAGDGSWAGSGLGGLPLFPLMTGEVFYFTIPMFAFV